MTRHGYCDVLVPKAHKIGSIGSRRLKRFISGIDDRLKLEELAVLNVEQFWAALSRQLVQADAGRRQAVLFIHGYNVSFEDAAIRAAQIGFDLGIEGAMAFFSWPSRGVKGRYKADEASIEGAERPIADFLVDFATRSGADAVHIIAHSMGNRGLLRAVSRIAADAERRTECRFGQVILAAPDVDTDNFSDLATAYRELSSRTTLYVSSRDRAVGLSSWIHDYDRVGFEPPVTVVDGIDTITVTNIDLTMFGHGYVAEQRPVLEDIHRLISDGKPPPRFGMARRQTPEGATYWEMRA